MSQETLNKQNDVELLEDTVLVRLKGQSGEKSHSFRMPTPAHFGTSSPTPTSDKTEQQDGME